MNKHKITVAKGFQTSINIAYDLYNDDKVNMLMIECPLMNYI